VKSKLETAALCISFPFISYLPEQPKFVTAKNQVYNKAVLNSNTI